MEVGARLASTGLSGITLYEPAELVIAARSGTPVSEVVGVLAAKGQELPFEPMDYRPLLGTRAEPTIGAVAAMNISGPRRIMAGAARDSLIGVRAVNGRGEVVKSGGRVMKNVTGLDLVKLLAGSWGTLGFLTEVTFKVLPKTERMATLLWRGLDERRAIEALSSALGSPFDITGAAHLPGRDGQNSRTLVRIEGFSVSVDYRLGEVRRLLRSAGAPDILEGRGAELLWQSVRDATRPDRRRLAGRLARSPPRRRKRRDSWRRSRVLSTRNGSTIGAGVWCGWRRSRKAMPAPPSSVPPPRPSAATRRSCARQKTFATQSIRSSRRTDTVMALTRGIKTSFDPARHPQSGPHVCGDMT